MRIVYHGAAYAVYAAAAPSECMATEVDSMNFEIADAMAMEGCPVEVGYRIKHMLSYDY